MSMHSQAVPTNEQGVEHVQDDSTRSAALAIADAEKQGMEHIQYSLRSGTSYEVVQANEDGNQQGIEYIQTSMRSGTHKVVQANEDENHPGIEHIQYCIRSGTPYEVVQANEDRYQQGIEHIQTSTRSGTPHKVVQANEDGNKQGIEHIQTSLRSGTPHKVVQANEDENQQGIEHIQYGIRSGTPYKAVQANEDYQQGIEHIQYCMRSRTSHKVVQANEAENQQGIEHVHDHELTSYVGKSTELTRLPEEYDKITDTNKHQMHLARNILALSTLLELVKNGGLLGEEVEQPVMEPYLLGIIKFFHEVEANSIQMVLEEEPENMNQKYDDTEHLKKQKELILKIYDTENCQLTMCKILRKAGRDCSKHYYELVKANEEGNQPNFEHLPYCIRSTVPLEVVRAFEHRNQKILRRSMNRKYTRSTGLHRVLEETGYGVEQPLNHRGTKRLLTLFTELLELVQIGELHGNVKPEPETSAAVVRLMKLLYHYGLDIIQSGVEEELKEVKQKYDAVKKDPATLCKKKLLEIMLRICGTKTCQRTIYQIICNQMGRR
ncbi:hypothetical protein POM88_048763 [Heracleum sosnowskyi]|uniref:Uncharacterized protein n=1 Tax=Heracleum sosnowskyi TaxID=360622 RepID=A0AAD8GUE2_9APIA|nr:hypothetical protein POM88_048763 [Heracleum sosnowskyi]